MSVVKKEIVQRTDSLQLRAGQVAGVESTIHSIVDLFESKNSATALQTNATNDFNSLNCSNCSIFLHNIKVICPETSNFAINYYTLPPCLLAREKTEPKS